MTDAAEASRRAPPWHAPLWGHFGQAIESDRVAHGLLVCGPPGVGKRRFAARIVAALLCRERLENGDACDQCATCRQRLADTHPDISRLVPEERGKLIKVDQVRAFSERLHLTPQYATGRIGWIEPAEDLSPSAANSLLKTLEEPPRDCHIVLVTDRVSALMATVRSRCQLWRVPPPDPETAASWLDAAGVDAAELDADSLRAPFGVIERASRDYASLVSAWDDDLANAIRGREDIALISERLAGQPRDLFMDWLYRRAGAMLAAALEAAQAGTDPAAGAPSRRDLPESLARIAIRLDPFVFQPWCARVADTARLARTNADWQLVIESLLLSLKSCLKRRRTL